MQKCISLDNHIKKKTIHDLVHQYHNYEFEFFEFFCQEVCENSVFIASEMVVESGEHT